MPPLNPCTPSPCGPNAVCQERNNAGSCSCINGYFGNPYEGCRPECLINSDCPQNRACINNKCQDPCPGLCGLNAECQIVNHVPNCICVIGYVGNPYNNCVMREGKRFIFRIIKIRWFDVAIAYYPSLQLFSILITAIHITFQNHQRIHALHLHVDRTALAGQKIIRLSAPAYLNTLETLLIAGQNV